MTILLNWCRTYHHANSTLMSYLRGKKKKKQNKKLVWWCEFEKTYILPLGSTGLQDIYTFQLSTLETSI